MTQEEFIRTHRNDDIRQLALKARPDGIDMGYAVEQIAGWQAACRKLPTWAATEGIIFPAHLSMEQCSSEPTAIYKRRLALRLTDGQTESIADLTGGFGVDFSYMAQGFKHATYVERKERLCEIARHNFPLLGLADAKIVCTDGTSFLETMPHVQLLFLDPARRDGKGERTFAISDCTPNVAMLRDKLLEHAENVVIKLSPMLDWHKAATDMQGVSEVHIVAVKNECKELLLVLGHGTHDNMAEPTVYCVDCSTDASGKTTYNTVVFNTENEEYTSNQKADNGQVYNSEGRQDATLHEIQDFTGMFLYEPNAAVMKSGYFDLLATRYGACQAAHNSHLYLSPTRLNGFPGREFLIKTTTGLNKKELRQTFANIEKANVAVRNFPLSVAELRKKLKLSEGGMTYVFATTLANGQKILFICEKVATE